MVNALKTYAATERGRGVCFICVCVSEAGKKGEIGAVLWHKCDGLLSDVLSACCFDTCQLHTSTDMILCVCKCA